MCKQQAAASCTSNAMSTSNTAQLAGATWDLPAPQTRSLGGQTISPITSSHAGKAVLEAKANSHTALKGLLTVLCLQTEQSERLETSGNNSVCTSEVQIAWPNGEGRKIRNKKVSSSLCLKFL